MRKKNKVKYNYKFLIYNYIKKIFNKFNLHLSVYSNFLEMIKGNNINWYNKKFGYKTEVMGASFRNASQIIELAGCDLLTISPELLQKLAESDEKITPKLSPEQALQSSGEKIHCDEKAFRFMLNADAMATEKLAEGIRLFCADTEKLEQLIINN